MPRRRRPARPGQLADLSPPRIATQIVLLQLIYYACAGVLIIFTRVVAGLKINLLESLLDWRKVRADITPGWTLAMCWMMTSLICVISILLLIARSKIVPDFALTIHGIHLLATGLYTKRIPTSMFWWATMMASVALMSLLGIWACQWRELKPMAFGGQTRDDAAKIVAKTANGDIEEGSGLLMPAANGGDTGQIHGLSPGHNARGGTGAYEMASILPKVGQG